MTDRTEAMERLSDILEELEQLGDEARDLVRDLSRNAYERGLAYAAFTFGNSSNPYDTTLASIVHGLNKDEDEDEDD